VLSMTVPTARANAACSVPNQISNGQVADASAVMNNFNALSDCANGNVNPSGSPAAGNLPVFAGPNSITNGNLAGDCVTAGSLSVTCTKTSGTAFGYFATGTDGAQLTGTISANRFAGGVNADSTHFLRGDGVWAVPPGTGSGPGSGGTPTVRAYNIQSSSSSSYTVTWPTGTVAGDVVLIFGEHGWTFANPAGWIVLDNQSGSNTSGFVIAKIISASDITAGSVTITTSGVYNGVLAAVAITGSSMTGIRTPPALVRSSGGPAAGTSVPLSSSTPYQSDLILSFVGIRAATDVNFSSGFQPITRVNALNASGAIGQFTGSLTPLGLSETATSSAAGSGYYSAVVILR